jgi:TatD DNase family protein
MLIDTHTHVDMPVYDSDRSSVIERARETGLVALIAVGAHLSSSERTVALAREYDFVYAAVGVHPHDVKDIPESEREGVYRNMEQLAGDPKVVAWGETGLDYYYEHSPRDLQQEHFREQIRSARRLRLPLIIHSRDSREDTLNILKEEKARDVGGVFHCFSGDAGMADQVLDLGFHLSFSGMITFKNAGNITDVARRIPLDRLLIETDCPYLTPIPYRGKRNEPAYVRYVAEKLAEIKGISTEEIARATGENASRLFGIPKAD